MSGKGLDRLAGGKPSHVKEVGIDGTTSTGSDEESDDAKALLVKSLQRYQLAIRAMQERLQRSEAERKQLERQIEAIRKDMEALKKPPSREPAAGDG